MVQARVLGSVSSAGSAVRTPPLREEVPAADRLGRRPERPDLDELEAERLDPCEHSVELRLVADLAAQHRCRRLDLGVESLEALRGMIGRPSQEVVARLVAGVRVFAADAGLSDDLTLMVAQRTA